MKLIFIGDFREVIEFFLTSTGVAWSYRPERTTVTEIPHAH